MKTEEIWKLYSQDVYRFILSRLKDKEIAGDLLQEVFIKIHLKKKDLEDKALLKNWVFSIARNSVTDHFRKRNLTTPYFPEDKEVVAQAHSPLDCLDPLVRELPKKYREVIILSDIQGKKQQEVAEELGITLANAKSRIRRGRKLIQQGYIDCCNYTIRNGVLVGETKPKDQCKVCE